jgi:hypothetical protein
MVIMEQSDEAEWSVTLTILRISPCRNVSVLAIRSYATRTAWPASTASKASWRSKYVPYRQDHAEWLKIRNRDYSQWVEREELFNRERETHPDLNVWDACAMACEAVEA